MLPLIKNILDIPAYARLLKVFYGYYQPLEAGIDRHLGQQQLTDYPSRRKTSWILNDLKAIGEYTADIALDASAPSIRSNAQAFGALYVMEGSTLGGKIICKTIAENLGMTDKTALSFFYGYGPEAASRWKQFLAVLDFYSGKPEEDDIVATANNVFKEFKSWIHASYQ